MKEDSRYEGSKHTLIDFINSSFHPPEIPSKITVRKGTCLFSLQMNSTFLYKLLENSGA